MQANMITGIKSETQTESFVYSTQRTSWRPDWMPNGRGRNLSGAFMIGANLTGARNLDGSRGALEALWLATTCPDGSMSVGTQSCSEIF